MKSFKRIVIILITVLSIVSLSFMGNTINVNAQWKCDTTDWYYTDGDSYLTGWQFIDGNWYFFYSDGYMAHDCWIGDYYLNSSGAWTNDIPKVTSNNDTEVATSNDTTAMVYVASSGNGKKYHSNPKCSRMKGTRCITISEAQAEGYTPCKKCY